MDCKDCNIKSIDMISVAAHEMAMSREERKHKRLVTALIISIVLGVGAALAVHFGWLYTWNNYDFISEESTIVQDGRGINVVGDENEVTRNESGSESTP